MPTTRSMRALSTAVGGMASSVKPRPSTPRNKSKRKIEDIAEGLDSQSSSDNKKPKVSTLPIYPVENAELLPAVLSFSFEDAKKHLISVDSRFEGIFKKLPCRPFEQLERVDPFRTLVTSILGQQISWLAARSIIHKFIRLYFPNLPEKPPPAGSSDAKVPHEVFPTPSQVAQTDVMTLKTAGLSTRKAEYVQDLASRFSDARLTNKKLTEADDEELARLLIEVRGIGRWTVDMFALFSLRRPDILPVGDLGVQRGVIRWFLALHSPEDSIMISPKKLPKAPADVSDDSEVPAPLPSGSGAASGEIDVSSIPPAPVTPAKGKRSSFPETPSASPDKVGLDTGNMDLIPEPFTPSINKTLKSYSAMGVYAVGGDETLKKAPVPLPEGLTVSILKNRLSGKKIKGALLTPKEMEELTLPWKPYRSLGVFYMWALAEETSK